MTTREHAPAQLIAELEQGFGLAVTDLARALQVSPSALQLWRTGENAPPPEVAEQLAVLGALYADLIDLFGTPANVQEWLRTPLRSLQWRTPQELAREGRFDRVEAAFQVLASGIFL